MAFRNMDIRLRRSGSIYIVDISGEMDLYNAHRLKEVVNKMVAKGIRDFIINVDGVSYIDSTGIGALMHVHSTIKKQGRRVLLVNVKGTVRQVIQLTKLMDYFNIEENEAKALERLKAPN
ncbi:MAG: STAS domain-containing protein [Spirochaetaceae bacterium]